MATGTLNENEYVRFFNRFYQNKERKKELKSTDLSTTVIFKDGKKTITLKRVTKVERIGQKGKKTDIVLYYETNKIYKISIKDNTSIYWGSDDRYIREKLGAGVRKKLQELVTEQKNIVTYDKKNNQYKLNVALGFSVSELNKTYTIFGVEELTKRIDQRNFSYCDSVIRGEITDRDVERNFKENNITFNVKRIYKTLSDVPTSEMPMLFVYPAKRKTFDDTELEISGFSGIRGSFRSTENVQQKIGNRKFNLK
jgi:hypothetical protein